MKTYRRLSAITLLILLIPLLSWAQEFPGRKIYPTVPVIDTDKLARDFDRYHVVDARSNYEYDTLHIDGATNIPLNKPGFADRIRKLSKDGKAIVFYCNGHTCYKSYKAVLKARKAGLNQVYAYDAGIFDWARAHPDRAVLLGRKPLDPKRLIGKDQLNQHLLEPAEFNQRARGNVEILDVRDAAQRRLVELYPFRQANIPLDESDRLERFVERVKTEGKTLLVYDAAGKQVRWLQYRLEQAGLPDYWFMKGGIKGWFKQKE